MMPVAAGRAVWGKGVGTAPSWRIRAAVHQLVDALTAALDAKHPYTKGHSDRVADIAFFIARKLGLSREQQYNVHVAAHLHDVGKIGIPDALLMKPGTLTSREYEAIKEHSGIGGDILGKIGLLKNLAPVVRHHHERYDGRGYPDGLKGERIPLAARIICLADAYDAMTSVRAYRSGISHREALEEIRRCAATQFDPRVVCAFLAFASLGPTGLPPFTKNIAQEEGK